MSDHPVLFVLQAIGIIAAIGGALISAVVVVATWREDGHG